MPRAQGPQSPSQQIQDRQIQGQPQDPHLRRETQDRARARACNLLPALLGAALATTGLAIGCGGGHGRAASYRFVDQPPGQAPLATLPLRVRWTLDLAPKFGGRYIPVERSGAVMDPVTGYVFATSTEGVLWTLSMDGSKVREYALGAAVEAPPALDADAGVVWVVAVTGELHALNAETGDVLWKRQVGGPVSTGLTVSADALYLVTDDDRIVAVSRGDGEILWRHVHEAGGLGGLSVAGHAGVLLEEGRVYTGLTDGTVVALDASDGRVLWDMPAALDLEAPNITAPMVDVDTTPAMVGDRLFVASFASGVYELDPVNGGVRQRYPEYVGVIGLAGNGHSLVLSSAEQGVVCLDIQSMSVRWTRSAQAMRGAPSPPRLDDDRVFVGESRGALLALDLRDGAELARLESGHGYSAPPELSEGRLGFVLSNTARLLAFAY